MTSPLPTQSWIANFGRNLRFRPAAVYTPRDEQELLAILEQVKGRKIRVVGRLHSWSRAAVTEDVLVDLRHFDSVHIEGAQDADAATLAQVEGEQSSRSRPPRSEEPNTRAPNTSAWAVIGAGCQIKRALSELESQAGLTLPTLGLISEQTLGGSTATGTHGSGKHSLSHYIDEARIATYDSATGQPVIRTITSGPELRAARCALGCLGIVISVKLRCIPQYAIEECFRRYKSIEEVLAAEDEYPLQQFYWLPWLWEFYVQHRRVVVRRPTLLSRVYHWYTFLVFDIGLHVAVWSLVKVLGMRFWIHFFMRQVAPWTVIQNWKVVGKSQSLLVMEHELFRHIEVEIFVKRRDLVEAMNFVRSTLEYLDGRTDAIDATLRAHLDSLDLWKLLDGKAGTYTHHYFICVRRVLPDETLISMSSAEISNGERSSGAGSCWYALSFISYAWPSRRQTFFDLAGFLTHSMAALFNARPHWGKVCPLTPGEAERLYPGLEEFRHISNQYDPSGHFRNAWLNEVLFGAAQETRDCVPGDD